MAYSIKHELLRITKSSAGLSASNPDFQPLLADIGCVETLKRFVINT